MSKALTTSKGGNAIEQVGGMIEKGQKNQAGLVGTIALGALAVAGLAIKVVGDMAKK